MNNLPEFFNHFKTSTESFETPQLFTYPFYYTPHPLTKIAASEVQEHLINQTEWEHEFGIDKRIEGTNIGKMFGVLVVQSQYGEIGYLAAFSGKLAGRNDLPYFVPPIFDALQPDGFFRKGEAEISSINNQIAELSNDRYYIHSKAELESIKTKSKQELASFKTMMKEEKANRNKKREQNAEILTAEAFEQLKEDLKNESLKLQYDYKQLSKKWKSVISEQEEKVNAYSHKISALKKKRKEMSAALQQQLFDQYQLLNANNEAKSLEDIFISTDKGIPPAGAGDCAGPKLLQYAYQHHLKPIAIAEFWWGQSPKSEIRKHKHFYPSCKSKCEPILGHMLQGLDVEPNPIIARQSEHKEVTIIYEDDYIVVINKPEEYLSVPGKTTSESVYTQIKEKYPNATGPLIVHRLDMSTSGLMVLAKTKDCHEHLQKQFLDKTVRKRYVALLDGEIKAEKGKIELPLRVDLDNRPQQMVCYQYGKKALTYWEVLKREGNKTRILFYPVTGRTHQLRVHAAHPDGLNTPIIGDDLYGEKANRLHLHAELLEFIHPITEKKQRFHCAPQF